MNTSLYDLVTRTFAAVEAKDLDIMMSLFADDAVLIDPHFPIPRMHGKAAITEGLRVAIVRNAILRLHNRQLFRVGELSTRGSRDREAPRHQAGDEAKFPAVFILEASDGRITRMQADEPYGPPGIVGVLSFLARLMNRFSKR